MPTKQCIYWKKARDEFLKQTSKVQWLKYGDQNTKFFHNMIKARRTINIVFTAKNIHGTTVTSTKEVAEAF